MEMTRYSIGIDPSINNTGFAFIKAKFGEPPKVMSAHLIRGSNSDANTYDRIVKIAHKVADELKVVKGYIEEESVPVEQRSISVVVEQPSLQVSGRKGIAGIMSGNISLLMFAFGACTTAVATELYGMDFVVHTPFPSQWKGGVDKDYTKKCVRAIFPDIDGRLPLGKTDDIFDALALALYGLDKK